MFDTTYSPNGKYLAYYTGNFELSELWQDMSDDESRLKKYYELEDAWDQISPGWYVREVETGNTAYIPIETWLLDVSSFLTFDWTADEVLLGHSIQPEDSAFSLADTYATFREDVVWISKKGHEELSPYFDIGLLDAYVNEEGEYRYLSLDYTLFGGGPWNNGFGELYLYVTTLEKDSQPIKLAEIHFDENESFEGMEIYFREEKVDAPEKLHELLEQYMAGYTKVEMEYKTSEVSFPRDIVGWEENEKRQCLEELFESLEEFLECESSRNEQYLCKSEVPRIQTSRKAGVS